MYVLKLELDTEQVRATLESLFSKNPATGESGYVFDEQPLTYLTRSEAVEEIIRRDGRVQGTKLLNVA